MIFDIWLHDKFLVSLFIFSLDKRDSFFKPNSWLTFDGFVLPRTDYFIRNDLVDPTPFSNDLHHHTSSPMVMTSEEDHTHVIKTWLPRLYSLCELDALFQIQIASWIWKEYETVKRESNIWFWRKGSSLYYYKPDESIQGVFDGHCVLGCKQTLSLKLHNLLYNL